jgi:hypothetical protein
LAAGLLAALSGIVAGSALAGTDVQINSDAPGTVQNEIRITQNPTDALNLVVAHNDGSGSGPNSLGVSFSTDGGATWTDLQLSVPTHPTLGTTLDVIFDPGVASDSQGNIYAIYIATINQIAPESGIFIERSTDKGQTWTPAATNPTAIDSNLPSMPPGGPDSSYRFNDRCDMTVDGSNNVHVVWIKDVDVNQPTSDIYYSKSPPPVAPGPGNPTGLDFTGLGPGSVAPQTVNDNPGCPPACPPGPPGSTDFANAPTVAVASDGTIYVAWVDLNVQVSTAQPAKIKVDRSLNGGMSFNPDVTAQNLDGIALNILAIAAPLSTASGSADASGGTYPVLATDPANPQTVYLAFAGDPTGAADPSGADEADIFFSKSTNGGSSWSMPVRVNDDGTTNDQSHPDMAVKPDGTIDIVWYDKRNAAGDDLWDVYITKSTDGGATFAPNTRISDQSYAASTDVVGSPWLGEYLGIAVDSSNAYVAFTTSYNDSLGDVFFDSIANSAIGANRCPRSRGFWANHLAAWPVASLVLGSETYTQSELQALLRRPAKGDASLILAGQLIAARLNIANGSDPTPVSTALATADALLSAFAGKLPYGVKTSTVSGQAMLAAKNTLDSYNNGQLTPACTP